VRLSLGVGLLLSGAAHCSVIPFEIPRGFDIKDLEGEAAIPVDVMQADEPPAPAPPPLPEPKSEVADTKEKEITAPVVVHDAGARRDAALPDAGAGITDAGVARSDGLDGAVAELADAAGAGGSRDPRDPQAVIGAAGSVQADTVLVMVIVNAEVIRKNPVGAGMGFLLRGIPQWDEFMNGTNIDPVGDWDWAMISGPSLINTARDIMVVRYSAPDAKVDHAVQVVSKQFDRGGPFDAGVPGVKASLAHADRADRVILRPQSHVLVVVPPNVAERTARQLVTSRVPAHVRPGEAAFIKFVSPHRAMPEIPDTITELRLKVIPRADEGADLFIDGDTADAETARRAASEVRAVIRAHNDTVVWLATGGLLDGVDVTTDGTVVKAHLTVSRPKLEMLLGLVAMKLGVQRPTPAGSASGQR
jgi:hypothetical protein